jgi:hypothetical protein
MALFQSGPYQSKVVSGIVRQSRRWLEWGAIAWRRCRTAASWTAQILLYPVYAVFQASRGLRSRLDLWLTGGSEPIAPWAETANTEVEAATLAVDAPVCGILQALREMALPGSLPVVLDEAIAQSDNIFYPVGPLSSGALPQGPLLRGPQPQAQSLWPVAPSDRAAASRLATSHPASPRTAAPPAETPYQVQGIASRLDTRALVLVTAQNQVLDILSHAQQAHLRQRLIWELATHGRRVQMHQQQVRAWLQSYGPIQPRARQWPGRWVQRLMGWMQQSSVAIAANLFQESMLQPARQLPIAGAASAISLALPSLPTQARATSPLPPSAITPSAISAAMSVSALSVSALPGSAIAPVPMAQRPLGTAPPREIRGTERSNPALPEGEMATPDWSAIPYPPPVAIRAGSGNVRPSRIPYPPPTSASGGAMPTYPRSEADYIDTQASLIQYLRTPLEGCMRWLDRVFVWLETKLAALWHSE